MIKYIILVGVVFLSGYIGYGISLYYKNRSKFFKNLELLFDKLKTEIRFSQSKLIEILSSYETHSKDVKRIISNFVNCLNFDLEITEQNLFKDLKILNDEEKNMLLVFFNSLGKFDSYNQTNQLDNQKSELNNLYLKAEEEAKKYGTLYTKLGIILGLVIAIIFV